MTAFGSDGSQLRQRHRSPQEFRVGEPQRERSTARCGCLDLISSPGAEVLVTAIERSRAIDDRFLETRDRTDATRAPILPPRDVPHDSSR